MLKLLKMQRVLCIAGVAIGASPALAAEPTYLSCSVSERASVVKLDEAAGTATLQNREPRPATFSADKVTWAVGGARFEISRRALSMTQYLFGRPKSGPCKQIPPLEINPVQKWTMRALSLNCSASGRNEGNRPDIQLKGQMRLDLKYEGKRSRIVFNVTSKKGYRKISCDGRNHTATDPTKYVLAGKGEELLAARYRVRANFDEVDFGSPVRALRTYTQGGLAQAQWPEKIYQGSTRWMELPIRNGQYVPNKIIREYRVPRERGEPNLYLRIEFARVE